MRSKEQVHDMYNILVVEHEKAKNDGDWKRECVLKGQMDMCMWVLNYGEE